SDQTALPAAFTKNDQIRAACDHLARRLRQRFGHLNFIGVFTFPGRMNDFIFTSVCFRMCFPDMYGIGMVSLFKQKKVWRRRNLFWIAEAEDKFTNLKYFFHFLITPVLSLLSQPLPEIPLIQN